MNNFILLMWKEKRCERPSLGKRRRQRKGKKERKESPHISRERALSQKSRKPSGKKKRERGPLLAPTNSKKKERESADRRVPSPLEGKRKGGTHLRAEGKIRKPTPAARKTLKKRKQKKKEKKNLFHP